ncbi:filamentous hemagglutinin N-terminal domain-containing protein, partial [Thalassolituus oleivorans]
MTKNTNTSKNVTTAATGFLPKLKQLAEAIRNANLIAAGIRGSLLGSLIAGQIVMPVAVLAADVVADPSSVNNLPQGGVFSSGASESTTDFIKTIGQTESRITIKWDSFNIGKDYTVHFEQSSGDVALNQVSGSNSTISTIAGTLTGSEGGTVILLNPLGVIFTETSTVSVGALVAAAASMDNDDFVKFTTHNQGGASYRHSIFQISGSGNGNVTNDSSLTTSSDGVTITGGLSATSSILLLGGQVTNTGTINAGVVDLVGAKGATISFGSDVLGIDVTGFLGTTAASSSVVNSGTITARQITLEASTAASLLDAAVNNTGTLQATGIATIDGEIRLVSSVQGSDAVASVSNSGSLISEKGDSTNNAAITIQGDEVTLGSGDSADAKVISVDTGGSLVIDSGVVNDVNVQTLTIKDGISFSGGEGEMNAYATALDVSNASSSYKDLNLVSDDNALTIGASDTTSLKVNNLTSVSGSGSTINGNANGSDTFLVDADVNEVTSKGIDFSGVATVAAGTATDGGDYTDDVQISGTSASLTANVNELSVSEITFQNIETADLNSGILNGNANGSDTFLVDADVNEVT